MGMNRTTRLLSLTCLAALWVAQAEAQTAAEIIEKHLAASGGREALSKVTSRAATGAIVLVLPVAELSGTIEAYNKKPNKSRNVVKLDLSALGAGTITAEQRFDGTIGFNDDAVNGYREITGDQLAMMKNGTFPSPLLDAQGQGTMATLAGREPVNGKDAHVVLLTPKSGPATKLFIDAATFLVVKTTTSLKVEELGGQTVEQVSELADYRDVDGVKTPFSVTSSNPMQTIRITFTDVKHNVDLDDASFGKPAQ
jgi:outer membrane lipoprotein-sorting protein